MVNKGTITVETTERHMDNTVLRHGLDGSVVFMGLPKTAGWKPFGSVKLPHQTYLKHVQEWLDDNPLARKVAVLDTSTGEQVTVWVREGSDGPTFRDVPLSFVCLDCVKGVGDSNGAAITRQIEAHLDRNPDHTLVLSSEKSMNEMRDIRDRGRTANITEGDSDGT